MLLYACVKSELWYFSSETDVRNIGKFQFYYTAALEFVFHIMS